jgi:hypothetical protein
MQTKKHKLHKSRKSHKSRKIYNKTLNKIKNITIKNTIKNAIISGYQPLYIIQGEPDSLRFDLIELELQKHGLSKLSEFNNINKNTKVIYKIQYGVKKLLDKRIYSIPSYISNYINTSNTTNISNIINKAKLYLYVSTRLTQIAQKHMSQSWIIYKPEHYKLLKTNPDLLMQKFGIHFPEYYIIKQSDELSFAGKGIKLVNNYNDFIEYIKYSCKEMQSSGTKDKYIMISRYISNPLLFNGYKFHIRAYLVLSSPGLKISSSGSSIRDHYNIPDCFGIILSNKKYDLTDLSDDKHISHVTTCELQKCTYMYPFEIAKIPKNITDKMPQIKKEIKKILGEIANNVINTGKGINSWPDSLNAFEIFAADLMYDLDDNNVKLLEINHKPGFLKLPYSPEITKMLFKGIIF